MKTRVESRLSVLALSFLILTSPAAAQYIVTTVAGRAATPIFAQNVPAGAGGGVPALHVVLGVAPGLTVDVEGNIYFSSSGAGGAFVFKLNKRGGLTRVAGSGKPGYSGDGGPAVEAQLNFPGGVAIDQTGNIFIADAGNNRIRMVSANGTITTIAGVDTAGYSGDGGPATAAKLSDPAGLCIDSSGNVYVADTRNDRIRKIDVTGAITTVVGSGRRGYSGDGGLAASATLDWPRGLALDSAGNLYLADSGNSRVRKVALNGIITTIAGNGISEARGDMIVPTFSGDGGPAVNAQLDHPSGVALDEAGRLYIADTGNHRLRQVGRDGIITTIAGDGQSAYSGDGGLAAKSQLSSYGVATDALGNVYVADELNDRVRKISARGVITTVAGTDDWGYAGDGGAAIDAQLRRPHGLAIDLAGNLYVADTGNNRIRKMSPEGIMTTVAGIHLRGGEGVAGPAIRAELNAPEGVAVDATGAIYIADTGNNRILKVSPDGIVKTIAGNFRAGYSGDGGPALRAQLNRPQGLAFDAAGNLYIADTMNYRVRKITADGVIATIAGNGTSGYSGDGGPATTAQIRGPIGMAIDPAGDIYITDRYNRRVRLVSARSGIITTIDGHGEGFGPDGRTAVGGSLCWPSGVALNSGGDLLITDACAERIVKRSSDGTVTTIAGSGRMGRLGDGGPALNAEFNSPAGMVIDASGNIYIADTENNSIRKLARRAAELSEK